MIIDAWPVSCEPVGAREKGAGMLMTVTRGKAGRLSLSGLEISVSWREAFRRNEDLLTGVIFSRMRFLSPRALQDVIGLLVGDEAAEGLGEIHQVELWPRFIGLEGRHCVEPDVLLVFENAHLLIEVKPPSGGAQHHRQWRAEVEALLSEFEAGAAAKAKRRSLLHFLALGKTGGREGEIDVPEALRQVQLGEVTLRVHCREWEPLLTSLRLFLDDWHGSDLAVLEDWLEAFALFGMSGRASLDWRDVLKWLGDREVSLAGFWPMHPSAPNDCDKQPVDQIDVARLIDFSNRYELEMIVWK